MKRKRTEDLDVVTAAYLASGGMRQTEIAQVLDLSQAVISRLLKHADGKYLRKEVRFISEGLNPEDMQRVLERAGRKELSGRLEALAKSQKADRRGPVLRVFRSNASDRRGPAEFASQAAPFLRNLLGRSRICGVTWGGMLWHLATALRSLGSPPAWTSDGIQFVPLSGEPLGNEPASFSSSSLAHELDRMANGEHFRKEPLYLGMVPAFLPDGFTEQEVKVIWKLIGLVKSYDQIFGRHGDSFADELDTVLTSTGPAERALGFGQGRLLQTGKISIEQLQNLIIGDVGGVCFARPDIATAARRKLAGVTGRWTGMRLEHLQKCFDRAALSDPITGPPGVVVISTGKARGAIICEAIRSGVVNHLIIDQELEQELERILPPVLNAGVARHGSLNVS